MAAWGKIAGGIVAAMAAVHEAQAESRRKDQLNQLSELPGVDIGQTTRESLDNRQANFQQASQIAGQQNAYDQAELMKLLESAIPGYKGMQDQRAASIAALLGGHIPDDVRSQIFRKGAGWGVSNGQAGNADVTRAWIDRSLGRTSLDNMETGRRNFASMIGSTPMARLSKPSELAGPDPNDVLGLRSKERTEKIALKLKYIGQRGATDVHADFDKMVAGQLMGGNADFGDTGKKSSAGNYGNGMESYQGGGAESAGMMWA